MRQASIPNRQSRRRILAGLALWGLVVVSSQPLADPPKTPVNTAPTLERATFGGGCFWCVEAIFEKLDGVRSVTSGYCGGQPDNPSYEQVCQGTTGHAEVVQVEFDPKTISFEQLLEVFWIAHDPTTKNRQGADVGTQYRSVIFYHSPEQFALAERSKAVANAPDQYNGRIVTEIEPLKPFFEAEKYHQDYYRRNPNQPYCQVVIAPKLKKLLGSATKR
jgi:peptide-methionine (S)-S-oxide reductase